MFDHEFIIKATSEPQIRALLANTRIRELISSQKDIHFSVKDDEGWFGAKFPEGVDELHFQVVGVIKDVERLSRLYDLFAETLDQLCEIGAALDVPPRVDLA
jgi:hypothetical protein